MKTINRFSAIMAAMVMVLFAGCAFQEEEKAPDAQLPVIMSITPDVTTLLNIQQELTVTAQVEDKGILTYQWYASESKLVKGTAIENATEQTYTPPVTQVGTTYYYCVIKNKLGDSIRSVISPTITYTVKENINAKAPVIIEQPASQALEMGKNFVLNVAAYSPDNGTLTYQWYFSAQEDEEGTAIENATEASYEGSVTKSSIGNYWCVVTSEITDNGDGGSKTAQAESKKIQIKTAIVNAATPIILKQPEDSILNFSEKFSFNIVAYSTDNGTLTYQWYKDDQLIEGATKSTYSNTVSSETLGNYYCEVTSTITDNEDGGIKSAKAKTESATLEAKAINAQKPVIQQMPVNISAEYGIQFSVFVTAHSTDGGELSYQWYKDNKKIDGANNSSYRATVSSKTLGEYYCEVTNTILDNGDGGVKTAKETSNTAIVSKNAVNANAPVIVQNPVDVAAAVGKSFTFTVAAYSVDKGTLTYQWYKEDVAIDGATQSSYTAIVSASSAGSYYCKVTNTITDNADGGKKSSSIETEKKNLSLVKIDAKKPVILMQPESVATAFGNNFSFTVIADSPDEGTLTYQWYKISDEDDDEVVIPQATANKYTGVMSANAAGSYYCIVTNVIEDNGDGGKKSESVKTATVTLAKNMLNALTPVITTQPADSMVSVPGVKVLSVGACTFDDGTLSYQWYTVEEGEEEGVAIEGATQERYKVCANDQGKNGYYCIVTNTLADNGDGGNKTASVKSSTAWVNAVYDGDSISAPDFTVQPVSMNIAPYNQSIELSCTAEAAEGTVFYRWYQSTDGTTNTGIQITGANTAKIETPVYTEKGIYYYYCVATTVVDDIQSAANFSDVVSVAYTGLPTLYLNTEVPTASITKEEYVFGDFKLITKDYGITEYSFSKIKNGEKKEGVKGRGNSTWLMPKKGYAIKFDKKQSLFGLAKAKKWCIIANYSDKTLLRNKIASIMGNDLFNKEWNPVFYNIDVVLNGEYKGNYIFCERNTLGEGRIDIQDISDVEEKLTKGNDSKIKDSNGDGIKDLNDGGFLIEVEEEVYRARENDFYFKSPITEHFFCLKDPDNVSEIIHEKVESIVTNAENILYSNDFLDLQNGWRKYIDENSVIDWYIINEFAKNNDSKFYSSVYMYYNPIDEKLHLGPIWDFDIAFGNINYNGCNKNQGFWVKESVWISRMFEDDDFVVNLKDRWNEKKMALYSLVNDDLQIIANENTLSAEYNFKLWQILGLAVWPNPAGSENRTTYLNEIEYLSDWMNERFNWIDASINEL